MKPSQDEQGPLPQDVKAQIHELGVPAQEMDSRGYQEKAPPYRQYLSPEFIAWLGESAEKMQQERVKRQFDKKTRRR